MEEELELQNTFNEDSLEELNDPDSCVIENIDMGGDE